MEIATALKRGIRVIPVLFDNIEMPQKETLPEDIQGLCNRQAIAVDKVSLRSDVERLAAVIRKEFRSPMVNPLPIDTTKPDVQPPTTPITFSKTDKILSVIIILVLLINSYFFL